MVWVDCIFFICSYYDAIVDLIIYVFVIFREFGFEEDVDVLLKYYLIVFYCVEVFFEGACIVE